MGGRERAAGQLEIVIIDSKTPIGGPKQQKAYLETYLPALLEGRLGVPRRNMRLDWAVEQVVANCLKCCPKDPGVKSGLALEIVEKSPYPEAKMKALGFFEDQSEFLQGTVERLIAASDSSDAGEFRSTAFGIAAKIGGTLRPDYFPLLFQSLAGETDQKCLIGKFLAVSRYLGAITRPINSPRVSEERLSQLLGQIQNRIEALNDPLAAIDLIFSVLCEYDYDGCRGIVFKRPPFDLATLQKICREAPPEQRAKVINRVRYQLDSLVGNTYTIKAGTHEARAALIDFAFPSERIIP